VMTSHKEAPATIEAGLSFPRYVVRKADYWRIVEEHRG
jgi:hypothetical protein